MSAVAAQLTYFQKQHKNNASGYALRLDQAAPAIAMPAVGRVNSVPKLPVSTTKRTARKRSLQERRVDLSLACALLGGIGPHHHALNNRSISHEEKTLVAKFCFAYFKLTKFSMFTRKKQTVVMP